MDVCAWSETRQPARSAHGADVSSPAPRGQSTQPAGRVIDAVRVRAVQHEPEDPQTGRYDCGPCVLRDGERFKMWWVRLGGAGEKRFPYATTLPDGERFEFTYPDRGDRVYYAESRDGVTWRAGGDDYAGPIDAFGPDARGPMLVLAPAETDQQRFHVGCPSVIKVAGVYYLYYEAPCEFVVTRGPDGRVTVGDEYHNQVFVATSRDGKRWRRHPDERHPRPIVPAPASNTRPGRRRYGIGQPTVFHRKGCYVMHCVDSCTGPGEFIIRLEADNPFFIGAKRFLRSLARPSPPGSVARFAQTDVKWLDDVLLLVRPAYGTGRLGLLSSRSGLFDADADARHPRDVFPQIAVPDARGESYRERLFPRFLTDPHGQVLVRDGHVTLFYSSGAGFKSAAHTWDLQTADVPLEALGARH